MQCDFRTVLRSCRVMCENEETVRCVNHDPHLFPNDEGYNMKRSGRREGSSAWE